MTVSPDSTKSRGGNGGSEQGIGRVAGSDLNQVTVVGSALDSGVCVMFRMMPHKYPPRVGTIGPRRGRRPRAR